MKNIFLFLALFSINVFAQNKNTIIGKWDLEVEINGKKYPSWLEVKQSGNKALVGYFVFKSGSARPISEVFFHNGIIDFSIPPQWDGLNYLHFQGILSKGNLTGTILTSEGQSSTFTGTRAPKLIRTSALNGVILDQFLMVEIYRGGNLLIQEELINGKLKMEFL